MIAACQSVPPPPRQGAFEECQWAAKYMLEQAKGVRNE